MKQKVANVIMWIAEILLMYVAPVAIIISEYIVKPNYPFGYKLGIGGVLLLSILFIIICKMIYKKINERIIETTKNIAKSISNEDKVKYLKKYQKQVMFRTIFNKVQTLLPFLMLYLFIVVIQNVNYDFAKSILYIVICMGGGTIIAIVKKFTNNRQELEHITEEIEEE